MKARNAALLLGLLLLIQACGVPPPSTQPAIPVSGSTPARLPTVSTVQTATGASVSHVMQPSDSPPAGQPVYDVESSGTGPEKRAPYGDSYKINRFERPFLQDMSYVPDLDIASYTVSSDQDWYYVSIELIGTDPNNPLGIDYAVELDLDSDGFGDTIIVGRSPFKTQWETGNVQIFADQNHDTGGASSMKSEAPFNGDGYEKMIFNGGAGDPDPDMAWVRIDAGPAAQVQFAFKKSLGSAHFMLGVLADAGLKDVTKMDYVDRFTASEAGSPVRDNQNYPLQSLFAVDNVCREGVGFKLTGNEPQGCPVDSTNRKKPEGVCPPEGGCTNWDPVACTCIGAPAP
jgi:hypothetical protein